MDLKTEPTILMKLQFSIRYHTKFGESLWLSGNIEPLGMGNPAKAIQLQYLNDQFWHITIEVDKKWLQKNTVCYKYYLKGADGEWTGEWGQDKSIPEPRKNAEGMHLLDTWNYAGTFENAFFTAPFNNVLLPCHNQAKAKKEKHYTHVFRVKAPLLKKHEVVCLLGNSEHLGHWNTANPILMGKEGDWWTVALDMGNDISPIPYKYAVYNTKDNRLVSYESGDNRLLYNDSSPHYATVLHDGFIHFPNNTWKGAGVAIPVFSLRSKKSFGVGEFNDMKLLVDWAKETGLKLIQILPVNDTIATDTWIDSYPYAAISAFALHPLYINLATVAGKKQEDKIEAIKKKQKQLNDLPDVDYEEVMRFKLATAERVLRSNGQGVL